MVGSVELRLPLLWRFEAVKRGGRAPPGAPACLTGN
ncbi:hypothetical protein RKD23_007534 [Streptomyces sp. SAI-170]